MNLANSKCRGNWLHRFELVGASDQGVLERCEICHMKKSFRTVNGTINNIQYLSYHMRNGLQKEQRLFNHEYPNQKILNRAERRATLYG